MDTLQRHTCTLIVVFELCGFSKRNERKEGGRKERRNGRKKVRKVEGQEGGKKRKRKKQERKNEEYYPLKIVGVFICLSEHITQGCMGSVSKSLTIEYQLEQRKGRPDLIKLRSGYLQRSKVDIYKVKRRVFLFRSKDLY